MKTLAITGGIGGGKSLVCSFFAEKGIPVYDSDSRTKVLYDTSASLAASVKALAGERIYRDDGTLDRRALAELAFSDGAILEKLEKVVHPAVKQDFEQWKSRYEGSGVPFVILESAIILDKPLFRGTVDKVLEVEAPVEVRIRRAAERDGSDPEAVRSRVLAQTDRHAEVDYRILNDGSVDDLRSATYSLYEKICRDFEDNKKTDN